MVNPRVKEVLITVATLDTCTDLTLTCNDNKFQLFYKGKQLGDDLTQADLRAISRNALKMNIVQHVDVSNLLYNRRIQNVAGFIKIEDDVARAFLHIIHRMKFQKPGAISPSRAEVAV
ncbi:hypothetical protein BRM9_1649 [Methanobacterium formicicum]|uniref:Uncharacterized protein n=1 Tax=Methanobacterium formicicum TaxID=2162 RepID=A0A089ZCF2_METFO|nr:hypothetical protein [Methanobacterium formicicum]AIS32461.1 hypothetical protein BRM9_1649 [Methanobacterium formicicum]